MNRIHVALFALGLAVAATPASALPGFRVPAPDGAEARTYREARSLAMELLRRAAPRLSRGDARLARLAAAQLAGARVLVSADAQARATCRARRLSLFVHAAVPGRVFVCDEVRPHARRGGAQVAAVIAQGLVHEAAHLAGVRDECTATRFERAVMDRTIGRRSAAVGAGLPRGARCSPGA